METLLMFGTAGSVFNGIKKFRGFIFIKTNDGFFVNLGNRNLFCRIIVNGMVKEKIPQGM